MLHYVIFNLTFTTGKIPDDLKVALVTLVYKASEENIYSKYRFISVLPCFSKIREKLMYKRLFDNIHKNGILNAVNIDFEVTFIIIYYRETTTSSRILGET